MRSFREPARFCSLPRFCGLHKMEVFAFKRSAMLGSHVRREVSDSGGSQWRR